MTISSVMIINHKGEILIHRSYKDDVTRTEATLYCNSVIATKEAGDMPIVPIGQCHFVHVVIGELIFVATTKTDANVVLILKFLYKMTDVLKAYMNGKLDEANIRKHFVLIYELLDEILDFGLPQILEIDILKKYITSHGGKTANLNDQEQLSKITVQATGSCSWRAEGIKYRRNEVYIDVVESVNALISVKGQVLRADVSGQVNVNSKLSGMPECKFGMNDKLVMNTRGGKDAGGGAAASSGSAPSKGTPAGGGAPGGAIALDDVRFHQCVRLSKYDLERTITFIPPDGNFELMTYRITDNVNLPYLILPFVQEKRSRVEVSLKIIANYDKGLAAKNVVIKIPVPKNAAKAVMQTVSAGRATLEPQQHCLVWRIRRFPGKMEHTLVGEVELASSIQEVKWVKPPIAMDFQVPGFTSSGLRVRFFRVQEKSNYKALKWIRKVTKAGTFAHRV